MTGSVSQTIWSNLFYLYFGIALVVGALVVGWCLYSLWRFREGTSIERPEDAPRAGYLTRERGSVLGAYIMAGTIAAVMFGLAFSTIDAINIIEHAPVDEPTLHHEVTGFQFGWIIRYFATAADGTPFNFTETLVYVSGTPGTFRVPVDTAISADITSRDVQHVFGIPEFRVQIYASPGAVHPIWFKAEETGIVPLRCLRNCGVGHNDMIKAANIEVVSKEDYAAWIATKAPKTAAEAAPAASTNARSALLEDGQIVIDDTTLTPGSMVAMTLMNRESEPRFIGIGPEDTPWATATVAPGADATLTFEAPKDELTVWSRAVDSTEVSA